MLLSRKEGALIGPIREVRAKGMSHMILPQSQTHMTSILSLASDVPLSLGGLCDTDSAWAFMGPSLCFGAPWSVSNSTWLSVSTCSPQPLLLPPQVVFSRYCSSSDIMDLFCIATGLPRWVPATALRVPRGGCGATVPCAHHRHHAPYV